MQYHDAMKPAHLTTKIFLDSGDPEDTKKLLEKLGFLDGQTTNPSLVAKKLMENGTTLKLSQDGLLFEYRKIIEEISQLIPQGSVSIEVYADKNTLAEEMLSQGRDMFSWIPNAHIKFPTSTEGLKAAAAATREGIRVNMTLVFDIEQAAAIYAATQQPVDRPILSPSADQQTRNESPVVTEAPTLTGKPGKSLPGYSDVFISPFVGRLDDRGENGMDLVKNIADLYKRGDGHVEILAASIRNMNHFLGAMAAGAHIITAPFGLIEEWAIDKKVPDESFVYDTQNLSPIPSEPLNLNADWTTFDISHSLTDTGLEKFASDWNALIEK